MPTITTLFCFDVQHIDRIEGTPCSAVMCPMCKTTHRLPRGHGQTVKAVCPSNEDDPKRPRADYWSLIHGGSASREMILSLETGDQLRQEVIDAFLPRDLWWPFQTIDFDPTTQANVLCLDLETQREASDEFMRSLGRL